MADASISTPTTPRRARDRARSRLSRYGASVVQTPPSTRGSSDRRAEDRSERTRVDDGRNQALLAECFEVPSSANACVGSTADPILRPSTRDPQVQKLLKSCAPRAIASSKAVTAAGAPIDERRTKTR